MPKSRSAAKAPSAPGALLLSPDLPAAPVLDRMCSQFVLTLTLRHVSRFNVRRDWASLLGLVGRHLAWPPSVLARLRAFLAARCRGNAHWQGHEALSDDAFMQRHGAWRGPYDEGTLFFYLDEYVKDAPKDLMAVLDATAAWLDAGLRRRLDARRPNIDALAGLLQLNPAERALLLYGTLARCQRDLRGLLVEFKVASADEAHAAIAAVAGVEAREVAEALRAGSRLERMGMVENLISEHNITDLADLMKRVGPAAAGADARVPGAGRADGGVRPAGGQERAGAGRLRLRRRRPRRARRAARPRRRRARGRRQRAALRPARHRQDRAGARRRAGGRARPVRGRVRRPRRQRAVRPRPLPLAADRPGVPEGEPGRRAAVRRGRGRVPADLGRRRAAHRPARRRRRRGARPAAASAARPGSTRSSRPTRCR